MAGSPKAGQWGKRRTDRQNLMSLRGRILSVTLREWIPQFVITAKNFSGWPVRVVPVSPYFSGVLA